ncbi:MAG: DUF6327 family protein [Fulvivirga sp.]
MKVYTSFDEINLELEILKLESEVEKEKLKRSYFYFKESISPLNVSTSLVKTFVKKAFLAKILHKILPF